MATHSSILAWRIPWTEEPGRLQSMGSQSRTRLKQLSTHACTHTHKNGVLQALTKPRCCYYQLWSEWPLCSWDRAAELLTTASPVTFRNDLPWLVQTQPLWAACLWPAMAEFPPATPRSTKCAREQIMKEICQCNEFLVSGLLLIYFLYCILVSSRRTISGWFIYSSIHPPIHMSLIHPSIRPSIYLSFHSSTRSKI